MLMVAVVAVAIITMVIPVIVVVMAEVVGAEVDGSQFETGPVIFISSELFGLCGSLLVPVKVNEGQRLHSAGGIPEITGWFDQSWWSRTQKSRDRPFADCGFRMGHPSWVPGLKTEVRATPAKLFFK